MKNVFELETNVGSELKKQGNTIKIIGKKPDNNVYVAIEIKGVQYHFIQDKDLERFAVNILKSLKSKHLNPTTND